MKKKKGNTEKFKETLKVETWSDTKCEESDEEYANICLMANSESDLDSNTDSDSDKEIEVSNFKCFLFSRIWLHMFYFEKYK